MQNSLKTTINAHIIYEGLVDVDGLTDFKYREKFLKLGVQSG